MADLLRTPAEISGGPLVSCNLFEQSQECNIIVRIWYSEYLLSSEHGADKICWITKVIHDRNEINN